MQRGSARRAEPSRPGEGLRNAIAWESALTREVIRLDAELLRADLRALEARLTLRIGMMMVAWFAATAVLILDR